MTNTLTRFTLRIPNNVSKWLNEESDRKGISVNSIVSLTLQEKMKEQAEETNP